MTKKTFKDYKLEAEAEPLLRLCRPEIEKECTATIRMCPDLYAIIQKVAHEEGRSMNNFMKRSMLEAVRGYVNRQQQKDKAPKQ